MNRYLATGESMTSIADQFRVGRSTAGVIIKDTLQAINKRLRPLVMPEPTTESWLFSAEGFWKRWNFPHCIGALDGKHINVEVGEASECFTLTGVQFVDITFRHLQVLVRYSTIIRDFTLRY